MNRLARVGLVLCLALGWDLHPATAPDVAAAICDEAFCGTIEIVFSPGSGAGTVTSDPSGLNCTWSGTARSGTCVYTYHWPYFIGGTNAIDLYLDPNVGSYACYSLVCGNHDQTLVRTIQLNAGDDRDLFPGFDLAPHLRLTIRTGGNDNGRVTTSKGGIDCIGTAGAESGTCVGDLYWNPGESQRFLLTADPADGAFACMYESCHVPDENRVSDVGAGLGANTLDVDFWEARPITVSITGQGVVVSKPAGISCPPTCSRWFPPDVPPDDWTEFRATPVDGWFVKSWSGCTSVENNVCIFFNYKFGGSIGVVFGTNVTQPPATPRPTAAPTPRSTPAPTPRTTAAPAGGAPTAAPPATSSSAAPTAQPAAGPTSAPAASGDGPPASTPAAPASPASAAPAQPGASTPVTAAGGPGSPTEAPDSVAGGSSPSTGFDSFVLVLVAVALALLLGLGFALGRRGSQPAR